MNVPINVSMDWQNWQEESGTGSGIHDQDCCTTLITVLKPESAERNRVNLGLASSADCNNELYDLGFQFALLPKCIENVK